MATEAQRRAKARYDARMVQLSFKLDPKRDADIIERLEACGSKIEYLRALVRADIERNGIC